MKLKSLSGLQILLLALKFSVLVLLFTVDIYDFTIENLVRRSHDHQYWKFAAVMGFSVAGLLSIGLASLCRNFLIRFATMLIVTFLIAVNFMAEQLTGAHLDSGFMVEIVEVFDDVAGAFIHEYIYAIALALLFALCAALLLSYAPKKVQLSSYFTLFIPLLLVLTFSIQLVMPRMSVLKFSPSILGFPLNLTTAYIEIHKINSLKRMPLDYVGDIHSSVDKIVLIIDESIYGDALSINGGPTEATPYLSSTVRSMINFGVGGSGTNRSAPSNLILRSGLSASMIPDKNYSAFTRPTIWQYAKKAGYESVYINAWPSMHHNFLRKEEIDQIDVIYGGYSGEKRYADFLAASRLRKELKSKNKSFIIVQKEGSHWPYSAAYPNDRTVFNPVTKSIEFMSKPDRTSDSYDSVASSFGVKPLIEKNEIEAMIKRVDKIPFDATSPEQNDSGSQRLNAYYNALNWSVDEFFRFLFKDLDLSNTVIIYTSDHGQYVSTKNEQSVLYRGHGSIVNPNPEEGIVPLIVFTEHDKLKEKFKVSADKNSGEMTHFEIFPTLINMMGFEPDWVKDNLGRSFLDPVASGQFFYYGSSIFSAGDVHKYTLGLDREKHRMATPKP